VLCLNTATFEISRDTTPGSGVCGNSASDIRLKTNIVSMEGALDKIKKLNPVIFDWVNPALHGTATSSNGFIAQELALIFPELVGEDGCRAEDCLLVASSSVKTINLNGPEFQGYMVKALQELNLNLENIASTSATSTPASQSFAASFFSNIFSRITTWLADAGNGIQHIYAQAISSETVYTKELCIDNVCIDKTQLQALLDLAGTSSNPNPNPNPNGGGGGTTPASTTSTSSGQASSPQATSTSTPPISPPPPAPISGCTDPTATNYDPSATVDDGSCVAGTPAPTPDPVPDPTLTPELTPEPAPPVPSEVDSTGSPQVEGEPAPTP